MVVEGVDEPGPEVQGVPLLLYGEALAAAAHHGLHELVRTDLCITEYDNDNNSNTDDNNDTDNNNNNDDNDDDDNHNDTDNNNSNNNNNHHHGNLVTIVACITEVTKWLRVYIHLDLGFCLMCHCRCCCSSWLA